jgi:hypothetical protein
MFPDLQPPRTVDDIRRIDRTRWTVLYVVVLVSMLVVATRAATLFRVDGLPALALLLVGGIACVARPVLGVHLIVFFSLLGDTTTAWWYPFNKNFSSYESILFLSEWIVINPLEVFLVLTTIGWLLRWLADPDRTFVRGALLFPLMVFTCFVLLGLANGMRRGGDTTIGLWEVRPLVYLPLLYVLITNLFHGLAMYRRLVWVAMAALVGQSLVALEWYYSLAPSTRGSLDRLTDHPASVQLNAFIIFGLALWMLPRCGAMSRLFVLVFSVPVVWSYLLGQRRAAFIGLSLGIILFAVLLYRIRRRTFWWFVPVVAMAAVAYLTAFWNAQGVLGFPAQAIKTVIAPDSLGDRDASSNLYREIEARNIWFTLRTDPLRGVGFGQPFYRIYQLPDISFFPFWEYMPHHSFLWIWLKTGFFGFVAMLFVILRTIQYGVRTVFRCPEGDARAIATMGVLYVVMYITFTYVDIAWDIRSMVFLAVAMAICADMIGAESRSESARSNAATQQLSGVGGSR